MFDKQLNRSDYWTYCAEGVDLIEDVLIVAVLLPVLHLLPMRHRVHIPERPPILSC